MMSYSEKIKKINEDRILMYDKVKSKICADNNNLYNTYEEVFSTLDEDSKTTKEYKSIIKCKELILELTNDICRATSVDDIIALRKKINYYINKIKKEMESRNISEVEYNNVNNKVKYLRKNISTLIRFMKRKSTLDEIDSLYEKHENLSDDDIVNFKKMLNKEMAYNSRILRTIDNNNVTPKVVKKDEVVVNIVNEEIIDDKNDSVCLNDTKSSFDNDISTSVDVFIFDKNDIIKDGNAHLYDVYIDEEKRLVERINYYTLQYQAIPLLAYDGKFIKKCMILLRNIPRYSKNKKAIRLAECDYNTFYHGRDLGAFIEYSKKRNSIMLALDIIFKKAHLSEREIECLYNHDNCVEWIDKFYESDNNVFDNNMKLVKIK